MQTLFPSSLDARPAAPTAEPPVFAQHTRSGTVEVFDQIKAIPAEWWERLYPAGWKDRSYYAALEETFGLRSLPGSAEDAGNDDLPPPTAGDFQPRYLVLRGFDGAAHVVQPLFLVEQDLTLTLPAPVRAAVAAVRRWRPDCLRQRILMVGSMVSDGRLGLPRTNLRGWSEALDRALELYARQVGASLIVLKDLPAEYRRALPAAFQRRYVRVPSWPATRLALDFRNWDQFVERRLGKATRKSLRRKFREVAERVGPALVLEVKSQLTSEEGSQVYRLYAQVARRSSVQFEVYNPNYFYRLGQRLSDRTRFFLWRCGERLVAFCFCVVHGDTIYDNDIGLDYAVAHDWHLYYVTLRDIFNWSVAQGIRHYVSSPYDYQPKLRLKMDLVPFDLYIRHVSRWVQPLLRPLARRLGPTGLDKVLTEFPNSHELWGQPRMFSALP